MVSLDLDDANIRARESRRNALLDVEVETPPGELLAFTSNVRNPHRPILSTPYYRRWKMLSYLPLTFGSCYTSGLTVYWDGRIIIGMASHGPGGLSTSIGRRHGEAMHFPLAPGEFLTSLWARASHDSRRLTGRPFVLTVSLH